MTSQSSFSWSADGVPSCISALERIIPFLRTAHAVFAASIPGKTLWIGGNPRNSDVFTENLKLRPCRVDQAIAADLAHNVTAKSVHTVVTMARMKNIDQGLDVAH